MPKLASGAAIRFRLIVRDLSLKEADELLKMCENIGQVDRYKRRRQNSEEGMVNMEVRFHPNVGREAFDEIKEKGWKYEIKACR